MEAGVAWTKAGFEDLMGDFQLTPRQGRARALTFAPPSLFTRASSVFTGQPGPSTDDLARVVDLFDFMLKKAYKTSPATLRMEGDDTIHLAPWSFRIDREFPGRVCLMARGPNGQGFALDPKNSRVEPVEFPKQGADRHRPPSAGGGGGRG